MHVLSDPTLGLVVEVGADNFTGSDLKTLLMRADPWQFGDETAKTANKQELLRSRILAARDYAERYAGEDTWQALLNLIG